MDSIASLIESSRKVILDCVMPNGAVIAANPGMPYYPKNVSNYHYVWPRDVAFVLAAAKILKISNIDKKFVKWLLERAEGFSDTGIIYQRYAVNGARDTEFGGQCQPDQAGALIWALLQYPLDDDSRKVICLLADGLCSIWKGQKFIIAVHDLWEERNVESEDNVFSYTLAACITGLRLASEKFNNPKWGKIADEMHASMSRCEASFFPRVCNHPDLHIDGSLLGLVWPFKIEDLRVFASIKRIEERLLTPSGILRYENDIYDGIVDHTKLRNSGAGGWPLLTYWYIIALSKLDRKAEAKKLFESYSKNFQSYIPEQLHSNPKPSISPLLWSHCMFVLAAKELGYI